MSEELDQLVSDTIAITGAPAPALLAENSPALVSQASSESMYLIGLIGGKEVGKSSFVNALVGEPITEQSSHGRGTEAVITYAHESAVPSLKMLLDREVPGRFRIHSHHID